MDQRSDDDSWRTAAPKPPAGESPRFRDAAALLPIIGLFLLMPPVITLFVVDWTVAGVPLIVVYVFGLWLALIVCAALLARNVARPPDDASAGRG